MDIDQRSKGAQGTKADTEMFDHSGEDEDLASQAPKSGSSFFRLPADSTALPEKLHVEGAPDYHGIADKELPPPSAQKEPVEEASEEPKSE